VRLDWRLHLLDITNPQQILRDPLVGSIFENMVVIECLKSRYNKGETGNLYFYRDSNKNEVGMLVGDAGQLIAVEIKSSSTYRESHFNNIKKLEALTSKVKASYLVYDGETIKLSNNREAVRFDRIGSIFS